MVDEQRNRQFWLEAALIFAGWTVFGLLMANQFHMQAELRGRPVSWAEALRPNLLESYLWAFTTLAIFWLARRFPLERGRVLRRIAVHLVAAVGIAMARAAFMVELGRRVDWVGVRIFSRQFWGSSGQNLLFYALLLGIAHAVLYHARYRERERAPERLAAGLAEARLQALKMQLQPHFLFNTLNAISALMHRDVEAADEMLARLSDLLRMALDQRGMQEIPLKDELEFVEKYLEIEQARFGDRFSVSTAVAPETLDAVVPNLVLQPLVENCVRHAVSTRLEPTHVDIRAQRIGDMLQLQVCDDGPGLPNVPSRPSRGVGLANTRARLEQLYGEAQRMEFSRPAAPSGLIVTVEIPFRVQQPEAFPEPVEGVA